MKKLIIIIFLIINSIVGYSQLSVTIDSLRQKNDTIWLTNRKGSTAWMRTHGDSLYLGDVSGEIYLGYLTGGGLTHDTLNTRIVRFNTSTTPPTYQEGQLYYNNTLNRLVLQTPNGNIYLSDTARYALKSDSIFGGITVIGNSTLNDITADQVVLNSGTDRLRLHRMAADNEFGISIRASSSDSLIIFHEDVWWINARSNLALTVDSIGINSFINIGNRNNNNRLSVISNRLYFGASPLNSNGYFKAGLKQYPNSYNWLPLWDKDSARFVPTTAITFSGKNITKVNYSQTTATTNDGDYLHETTQDKMYMYTNGIGGWCDKAIFKQLADVTRTGAVTAQSLVDNSNKIGTTTLPANFFKSGKTLRYRIVGVYTTDISAGNATVTMTIGGTTFRTTGSFALDNSVTNGFWQIEGEITCRTAGVSGTLSGLMSWAHVVTDGSGFPMHHQPTTTITAVTYNTTASGAFDVVWTADDAGTSITCTNVTLWEVF